MTETPGAAKVINDSDFADVQGGSELGFPCSPDLDDGFVGIRINAPRSVTILAPSDRNPITNAFANIVVCGAYSLKVKDGRGAAPDHIVIVARNDDTGRTYQSEFAQLQDVGVSVTPSPMPEERQEASQPDPESMLGGYFNPNIAHFIPEHPGHYTVHARLGTFRSNDVKIEITGIADIVQREGEPVPDAAFTDVEELSDGPSSCTPKLEDGFVGIRINAPRVVKIGKLSDLRTAGPVAKIMVCGAYALTEMNARTGAPDYFQVMFFNRALGEGFVNNIGSIYSETNMKMRPAPPRAKRGYFNLNLARMGRPASYGIYTVVVSTSDLTIKSNEIAVELVE